MLHVALSTGHTDVVEAICSLVRPDSDVYKQLMEARDGWQQRPIDLLQDGEGVRPLVSCVQESAAKRRAEVEAHCPADRVRPLMEFSNLPGYIQRRLGAEEKQRASKIVEVGDSRNPLNVDLLTLFPCLQEMKKVLVPEKALECPIKGEEEEKDAGEGEVVSGNVADVGDAAVSDVDAVRKAVFSFRCQSDGEVEVDLQLSGGQRSDGMRSKAGEEATQGLEEEDLCDEDCLFEFNFDCGIFVGEEEDEEEDEEEYDVEDEEYKDEWDEGSEEETGVQSIQGLKTTYMILEEGSGRRVERGSQVLVHAQGFLRDSLKHFWHTRDPGQKPFRFSAGGGRVIRGWDEVGGRETRAGAEC